MNDTYVGVPGSPVRVPVVDKDAGVAMNVADDKAAADKAAAEKAKRLIEAQELRKRSKTKPLQFVLLTLGAWWLLTVLADIVITCVPGGASCRVPYLLAKIAGLRDVFSADLPPAGTAAMVQLTKYEWPLLILSFLAALWVARAKVYPETDETGEFTEAELDGKPTADERDGKK